MYAGEVAQREATILADHPASAGDDSKKAQMLELLGRLTATHWQN